MTEPDFRITGWDVAEQTVDGDWKIAERFASFTAYEEGPFSADRYELAKLVKE